MVVCKFFQQGNCRFGKSCRYEHIYGSKYTYYANPPTQPIQSLPAVPQQPAIITDEQLVNQVQSDIQAVLKGGQWILSCYSPYKEKPIFPGILDLSPEEARLFIYEAKSSNNIEQAVTYMNNMFKEARLKYEQLMQPNVNIIKVLRSLYKGEAVSSPFSNAGQNYAQQNTFSNSNNAASSIFRSAVQTSPLTSSNANNAQSIFSQAQNSIFASTPAADPAMQIFSQASNQNVFAPSQSPGHVFAQQNQSPDPKSIFATAIHGNYNTTNQNQSPSNIFAAANQNVFAKEQNQNTSPFNQGNVFKTVQNPSSVFGQAVNKVQLADPSVYSKIEDLSDIDLEAYKSDSFELGFIPELPPPHELCTAPTRSTLF